MNTKSDMFSVTRRTCVWAIYADVAIVTVAILAVLLQKSSGSCTVAGMYFQYDRSVVIIGAVFLISLSMSMFRSSNIGILIRILQPIVAAALVFIGSYALFITAIPLVVLPLCAR